MALALSPLPRFSHAGRHSAQKRGTSSYGIKLCYIPCTYLSCRVSMIDRAQANFLMSALYVIPVIEHCAHKGIVKIILLQGPLVHMLISCTCIVIGSFLLASMQFPLGPIQDSWCKVTPGTPRAHSLRNLGPIWTIERQSSLDASNSLTGSNRVATECFTHSVNLLASFYLWASVILSKELLRRAHP